MKKRFDLFFLASLLFAACMTSCSDSNFPEPPSPVGNEPTEFAPMRFKLDLDRGDITTRSTQSSMRPITRWKDVKHLMMFLYDDFGAIRWAEFLSSQTFDTLQDGRPLELFYQEVPVGETFHFVALANWASEGGNVDQGILTDRMTQVPNPAYDPTDPSSPQFINENVRVIEPITLNSRDVQQYNIHQLVVTPKKNAGNGQMPDFYRTAVQQYGQHSIYANDYSLQQIGNLFRGGVDNFNISKNSENYIETTLVRDVALLRIRFNPRVINCDGLVDFTQNQAIFISNVPQEMHVPRNGADGSMQQDPDRRIIESGYQPSSATSIRNAVLQVYDQILTGKSVPSYAFKYQDPTEADGYEFVPQPGISDPRIVTEEFPLWRDIIVLPTSNANSGRSIEPYYLTISAKAKKGHKLHDGSFMKEDGTVYWSAKIDARLIQNNIYEYNIQLYGGGTYPLPPNPDVTPSPSVNPDGGLTDPNGGGNGGGTGGGTDPTDPTNPGGSTGGGTDPTNPTPGGSTGGGRDIYDPSDPNYENTGNTPGVDPNLPHGPGENPNPPVGGGTTPGVPDPETGIIPSGPGDGYDPDEEGKRQVPTDEITVPTTPYPGVTTPPGGGGGTGGTDPDNPNPTYPLYPARPDINPTNPIDPGYTTNHYDYIPPEWTDEDNIDPQTGWPFDPATPNKTKVIDPLTGDVYTKDPTSGGWPKDIDGHLINPYSDPDPITGERQHVDPNGGTIYTNTSDPTLRWPIDPETGYPRDPETGKLRVPGTNTLIPDPTWPAAPDQGDGIKRVIDPNTGDPTPLEPTPNAPRWYTVNPNDPTDKTTRIPVEPGHEVNPSNPYTWITDPTPGPTYGWPINPVTHHPVDPATIPVVPEGQNPPTGDILPEPGVIPGEGNTDPTPTIPIPGGAVPPALAPPSSLTDPDLPTLHIHNIYVYNWGEVRECSVDL